MDSLSFMSVNSSSLSSGKVNPKNIQKDTEFQGPKGIYKIDEKISSGSFGTVYKGILLDTNEVVAIKVIKLDDHDVDKTMKYLETEVEIMKKLDHPHIVKILDAWTFNEAQVAFIVMEYISGGTLSKLITNKNGLDEYTARKFFMQIVSALECCHSHRIHHRDIKPNNILVDKKKENLKICDFGLATLGNEDVPITPRLHSPVGTRFYRAPDVAKPSKFGYSGSAADAWSLGVTLYVMLTDSSFLFTSNIQPEAVRPKLFVELTKKLKDRQLPNTLSPSVKHLIRRMLDPVVCRRIGIAQIKKHPWYTGEFLAAVSEADIEARVVKELQERKRMLSLSFFSFNYDFEILDAFTEFGDKLDLEYENDQTSVYFRVPDTGMTFGVEILEFGHGFYGVDIRHGSGCREEFRRLCEQHLMRVIAPLVYDWNEDCLDSIVYTK